MYIYIYIYTHILVLTRALMHRVLSGSDPVMALAE